MHSKTILNILHGDMGMRVPESWTSSVRERQQRRKANKNDEHETDFIDIDELLWMYVNEYKNIRKQKMNDFKERFQNMQNLITR